MKYSNQNLKRKNLLLIVHLIVGILYLFIPGRPVQKMLDIIFMMEFIAVIGYMVTLHCQKSDQKIKRTLGVWCLVFPICIGANCFVYNFVNLPETVLMLIALFAFLITVLIWKCTLVRELLPIILVAAAAVSGVAGSMAEANALVVKNVQVEEVRIVNKEYETMGRLIENLSPLYYFTVEGEDGTRYEEVAVSKRIYYKYTENDQTRLTIKKGLLGVEYWYVEDLAYVSLFD